MDLVPRTGHAAIIDRGGATLSAGELEARVQLILEIMANVLEEGKDYGRIPGTDKPTLLKPGAEMLCLAFRLAVAEPKTEDLGTDECVRYRVAIPIEGPDGRVLAVGVGEASTDEEKYRWRKPVCDEEFNETPAHLRREKWFKKRDSSAFKGKQIRTSPADLANTALKMAHKRAFIHGTLLATGASRVFNQDLEDLEKELRDSLIEEEEQRKPAVQQPRRKSETQKAAESPSADAPKPLTVVGLVERIWQPDKKDYYAAKLKDDARIFTFWVKGGDALFKDLKAFEGTDHKVKLAYTETAKGDRTYQNAVAVSIADAEPEVPKTAADTALPLTGDEVFGEKPRDPGQEG